MSETEQVALDAGTVGWEGELFAGKPNWQLLKKQPYLELTVEEKAFIDGPVEELCDMLNQWEITHIDADLNPETWDFLKRNRFLGMIIPKEYGGLGFSAMAHRAVLQKISSICSVAGSHVAVPNSLGPGELLLHYGTEEQKNQYLPRLARGDEIPCFLPDRSRPPDPMQLQYRITGIVCKGKYKGKDVLGMRLNFDKRYITLAPSATLVGVAFRLYDPDGLLLGDKGRPGHQSCADSKRLPRGLEIGKRHLPLNVPFQNGPVRGKDVFVPLDALIGGTEMAGQGWEDADRVPVRRAGYLIAVLHPPEESRWAPWLQAPIQGIRKQFNLPDSGVLRASKQHWPGLAPMPTPLRHSPA